MSISIIQAGGWAISWIHPLRFWHLRLHDEVLAGELFGSLYIDMYRSFS
ncbi:hypothetical protein [Pradoshia sp.]